MNIHFQFEPADRSVGIMSESFSAWVLENDPAIDRWEQPVPVDGWCEITNYWENFVLSDFQWWDNEGNQMPRPTYAQLIERLLHTYAANYYNSLEEAYKDIPEE